MRQLATIQEVRNVRDIFGTDRIQSCNIKGWSLVVKKDEFNDGDKCVYVEIDSILPDKPEFEFMRAHKFIVKTVKMRGKVSQGICFPLSILPAGKYEIGDDVTSIIGITKYYPEGEDDESIVSGVRKNKFLRFIDSVVYTFLPYKKVSTALPNFMLKTDIERLQNIPDVLQKCNGVVFHVTEKLDGKSATFFADRMPRRLGIFDNFDIGVCSKSCRLPRSYKSEYWSMYKKYNIKKMLKCIANEMNVDVVVIQGEIVGQKIQGNKYMLDGREFNVFNIIADGEKMPTNVVRDLCEMFGVNHVPILSMDFKLPPTVEEMIEYSKGESVYRKGVIREGIVVRNYEEDISFKVINPDFLLKNDL